MKKTFKRLGAALLAMAMAVSVLCTGALAANTAQTGPFTITVQNETDGYEYQAYQIFDGNLATDTNGNKILSNIQWGAGVDTTATKDHDDNTETADATLIEAIKAITLTEDITVGDASTKTPFSNCTDAASVAAILNGQANKSEIATTFAKVVGKYLNTTSQGTSEKKAAQTAGCNHTGSDKAHYDISVTKAGYYLVKNTVVPGHTDNVNDATYSSYILEVVGDVQVAPKTSIPTVDKKIVVSKTENETTTTEDKTETTVGVNDTVNFKLTGTLPSNYADYKTYKYVFHDTLDAGLTLNESTIAVKVYKNGTITDDNNDNTVTLTKGSQYTVVTTGTEETGDKCNLEVTINNLKSIEGLDEKSIIVVTYSATLNSGAKVDGNKNEVHLEYSNNPNGDGTGTTKPEEVTVYTLQLNVDKVNGASKTETDGNATYTESLEGAKFILSTDANLQAQLTDTNIDANGDLKNGNTLSTSLIAVKEGTAPDYIVDDNTNTESKTYVMRVGTDGNKGKLNIQGLKPNQTYYLYETKAPDGYNKLTAPVTITIDANGNVTSVQGLTTENHEIKTLYVENNAGSQLPSTGGMGTTLFYIIGGVLMAGAAVVLVIKKKRSSAE